MGMDVKDVKLILWKVFMVMTRYCYGCVQKHPLVSGVLLFFLILYIFFPTIFKIIVYTSPIIACTFVYLKFYLTSRQPKDQHTEENEQKRHRVSPKESKTVNLVPPGETLIVVNKGNRSFVLRQTSRRRLVREKNSAWGAEGLNEGKDNVSLGDNSEELTGCRADTDETPGVAMEHRENNTANIDESSSFGVSDNAYKLQSEQVSVAGSGPPESVMDSAPPDIVTDDQSTEEPQDTNASVGKIDTRSSEEAENQDNVNASIDEIDTRSSEEAENRDNTNASIGEIDTKSSDESKNKDNKGAHEFGNNAAEWTEDDQKNEMVLGDFEQERNRRLESLIAKRKTRGLFKLALEKNLNAMRRTPSGQMAPILVSRTNHSDFLNHSDDSSIPGSAPSVLLPMRNPFDLPYDPTEEKPNLTEDSFQQEFMPPLQKEMFCRHGSFSLGSSFPLESKHDQQMEKLSRFFNTDMRLERHRFSRFRAESGEHDELIELPAQEPKPASHIDSASIYSPQEGHNSTSLNAEVEENNNTYSRTSEIEEKEMQNPHNDGLSGDNKSEYKKEADLVGGSTNSSSSSEEDEGSSQGNESDDQSEADLVGKNTSELSSSSSEDEEFYSGRRVIISSASKVPEEFSHAVQESLSWYMPKRAVAKEPTYDSSPTENDTGHAESSLSDANKGISHTPSYSIASDLVVEISEIGSPTGTVDISYPNSDEESSTYGGVNGNKNSLSSQDTHKASNHLSGTDGSDPIRIGKLELSGVHANWEEPKTFFTPREESQEPDSADIYSSSSSTNDLVRKIHDKVKQEVEASLEKACSLKAKSQQEELTHDPKNSSKEVFSNSDVDIPVVHANDNMKEFSEEQGSEIVKASTKQYDSGKLSKLPNDICSASTSYDGNNSDESLEHLSITESDIRGDVYGTSKSTVETGKYPQIRNLHSDAGEVSSSVEANGNVALTENNENEQTTSEDQFSSDDQPFENSVPSVTQYERLIDHSSENSSSSSSPNSVLQKRGPIDEGSLRLDQYTHTEARQPDTVGIEGNSLLDELPSERIELTRQENVHNFAEDQMTNPCYDSDITKEPAKPSDESTKEAKDTGKIDNLQVSNVEDAESTGTNVNGSKNSVDQENVAEPPKRTEGLDNIPQQKSAAEPDFISNYGNQHMVHVVPTEDNLKFSRIGEEQSDNCQDVIKESPDITNSSHLSLIKVSEGKINKTENESVKDIAVLSEPAREDFNSKDVNDIREQSELTDHENPGHILKPLQDSDNVEADKDACIEPNNSVHDMSDSNSLISREVNVKPSVPKEPEADTSRDNVIEPMLYVTKTDDKHTLAEDNEDKFGISDGQASIEEMPQTSDSSDPFFTKATDDKSTKTLDEANVL